MHNLSLLLLFASLTARAALVGRAPLRSPAAATRLSRLAGPPLLQLPDIGSLVSKLRGEQSSEIAQLGAEDSAMGEVNTDDLEFIPRVLVIGATGRTGTIVVRKLVLRGFRVSVLVRSLSTETLTRLGSNVQYSYGDILDYQSLLDAMEDVDKVVFAASAGITAQGDPATEEAGIRNILRALQDTRTFSYGAAEATKLSLFKFRRDAARTTASCSTAHARRASRASPFCFRPTLTRGSCSPPTTTSARGSPPPASPPRAGRWRTGSDRTHTPTAQRAVGKSARRAAASCDGGRARCA